MLTDENPMLSVKEVAALTAWSRHTITRIFERERGVIILENPETRNKRRYRNLRIPRSVYARVMAKMAVK